jgi:hypothetical protein
MNESFNPLERVYTQVTTTARTICYAAWITFLIAELLLIVGSTILTLSVTGSWPSPDTWALIAGVALVGGTLAYHAVVGLLLLFARARLRGMVQMVGVLLGLLPSGEHVHDLVQGVAGVRSQRASWLGDELGSAVKPTLVVVLVLAFVLLVSGSHKKAGGGATDYRYV